MSFVLGLDLGARSLGWAAIQLSGGMPVKILGVGVRIFEAGVEGDLDRGREESRAAQRRQKRLQRRQIRRRRQRSRSLYLTLGQAGLLPAVQHRPGVPLGAAIQSAINALDKQLIAVNPSPEAFEKLPYLLRARALDVPLSAFELGRALFHLGQRRGFQSNLKSRAKEDDEGAVKAAIQKIKAEMGGQTLGQFLLRRDSHQLRIRAQYTHREMYKEEFRRIWQAQESHHSCLTPDLRDRLWEILFFQRPLADASDLVGACEWDPSMKRTRLWNLEYQEFRVLQTVNHLRIDPRQGATLPLTEEQRATLREALNSVRELGLREAKKLLGLPPKWGFTLEEGKETKLKGNSVNAMMTEAIGDHWVRLSFAGKTQLLEQLHSAGTEDGVSRVLCERFQIPDGEAREAAGRIHLPQGYASLSVESIRRVLPLLQKGLSVQEARQQAGFQLNREFPVHEFLPPVNATGLDVRNPAVLRSLTELRKVVNAIVRKWGEPAEIHIEVARELKKSKEARQKESTRMRERERERDRMRQRIITEVGKPFATRHEIERGLLFDECNGHCPYTGESLGTFSSLFSGMSKAQVEHIIPRSLSLDDSFENLTLATFEANQAKGNRTPREAYPDPDRFAEILARVRAFKGSWAKRKLARFELEETDHEKLKERFASQQLNDTRYTARLAAEYLAHLYGGEAPDGKRKILKPTGQITAELRGLWNLNEILGGDGRKSRDDHRHHAIDAAVLAVTNQRTIQTLSEAASRSWRERKRRYAPIPPPWVGFKEELRSAIEQVHISFRPSHHVRGALHDETYYSTPEILKDGGMSVKTRRPVHLIGKQDRIVDERIRTLVEEKVRAAGGYKKLENDPPLLPTRDGRFIPVRKVRVEIHRRVVEVGNSARQRFAAPGEMHHMAVYEVTEGKRKRWEGTPVDLTTALTRRREGKPVVDRSGANGRTFLFSVCKGDVLWLHDPKGAKSGLWVVRKIWNNGQLYMVPEHDARPEQKAGDNSGDSQSGQQTGRASFAPTVGGLMKLTKPGMSMKVTVTPLGEIVPAHD